MQDIYVMSIMFAMNGAAARPKRRGAQGGNATTSPKKAGNAARENRIAVVEDHPFFRQEMIALINRQADLTCCGEADSIAGTLPVVAEKRPDGVVLDLRLKNGEAFDLIGSLKQQFPEVATLVLSDK
jgi:ActR/RegA family two-component response regulator